MLNAALITLTIAVIADILGVFGILTHGQGQFTPTAFFAFIVIFIVCLLLGLRNPDGRRR